MTGPVNRILEALERVTGFAPRPNGKGWSARCPAHEDKNPSLSIAVGDDGRALLCCHAGCTTEAILEALGLTMRDLMPDDGAGPARPRRAQPSPQKPKPAPKTFPTADAAVADLERRLGECSAKFTYHDGHFDPTIVSCRWDRSGREKDFRPVSRSQEGWIIGAPPKDRALYHLPELSEAQQVFVCEGEKATDAVRALGLPATTSQGGCKAAARADWVPLTGKGVVILPDNDTQGEGYAEDVAQLLAKLRPAPTVKVVRLPDLPTSGDAVEYIAARRAAGLSDGEIREEIERLADEAEPVKPAHDLPATAPVLVCLSDVVPETVQWLWSNRIPLGKLTLIAGDPGLGKSFVTLDIAARVSCGRPWPDARETLTPVGGVVLLSAEDDPADTIRPRLDAADADVRRIHVLSGVKYRDPDDGVESCAPFCLTGHLPALESAIEQTQDCRLVVVDPITAYLGRTDSHKNAELRAVLAPLAELAGRHRVAVVAVTHLRKSEGPAMYRAMGSLAFTAAARAVWAVTKDKDDEHRRLMLPVKNNLAADTSGLAYRIEPREPHGGPVVVWEADPVTIRADDALAMDRDHDDGADAADFLRELLAEGKQPAAEVFKQCRANGVADKATRRAFKALRCQRRREGFGPGGAWYWSLPGDTEPPTPPIGGIDSPSESLGNNGNNGDCGNL